MVEHKIRLTFLGRWHPNKGADLLLEALLLLTDEDWSLIDEVRFFGGGPLRNKVFELANQLQTMNRPLTLGGYLSKPEACALFQWTDYVLIPSRQESIPVVFSDAMQLGKPVISTPVGDLPRLIGEYSCGIHAEAISAKALAKVIRKGLRYPRGHFDQGIQRAGTEFELDNIVEQFAKSLL
jgi:glycosyltransferase involved in cell wall biosynthesis